MTFAGNAVYRFRMFLGPFRRILPTARSRVAAVIGAVTVAVFAGVLAVSQPWSAVSTFERWGIDPNDPPYHADLDPREAIDLGKARAAESGKMLMVTFGANWCPDCLTLHRNLRTPETRAYADGKFEMVHIDVGDSARTARVEAELGIDVNSIPLAVFYSADGRPVCNTARGELEPSRHYSSRQILDFLREVADHRRVVSPDQRQ
jgi:thiol:disulfide interchange protein